MSTNHNRRNDAMVALARIPAADNEQRHIALATEASAHALLAVEDRLGQIADRLGELVAAQQAVTGALLGGGR